MADIGIYHNSIREGGGAEVVASAAIEALIEDGNSVTLYTTAETNAEQLNKQYGTDISSSQFEVVNPSARLSTVVNRGVRVAINISGIQNLLLLRNASIEFAVRHKYVDEHDVFFSTQGEFFHDDVIQYIHFPYFSAEAMQRYTDRFGDTLYRPYHWACRTLKGLFRAHWGTNGRTLTNSRWTREVINDVYDENAEVVYPPVAVKEFDPPDWDEMEPGFVAVGRVHPTKRQESLIGIVDRLVELGYDTHIHIIGEGSDGSYYDRIQQLASNRDYVILEGRLPRAELVSLIEDHRFGIHGKRYEHFGISVAEMVAGGALPLVPKGGGQTEIIDDRDSLIYQNESDAVDKAARLLDGEMNHQTIFENDTPANVFDKARFARQIVSEVVGR